MLIAHSVLTFSIKAQMQTGWGEEELLIKAIIWVFFTHKKYSGSFIKLRLNHWCHMDLGTLQLCCGLCRVWELSDFIINILICVLKMNEGLTGLEWRESEQFITIFIFGWTIPLRKSKMNLSRVPNTWMKGLNMALSKSWMPSCTLRIHMF